MCRWMLSMIKETHTQTCNAYRYSAVFHMWYMCGNNCIWGGWEASPLHTGVPRPAGLKRPLAMYFIYYIYIIHNKIRYNKILKWQYLLYIYNSMKQALQYNTILDIYYDKMKWGRIYYKKFDTVYLRIISILYSYKCYIIFLHMYKYMYIYIRAHYISTKTMQSFSPGCGADVRAHERHPPRRSKARSWARASFPWLRRWFQRQWFGINYLN